MSKPAQPETRTAPASNASAEMTFTETEASLIRWIRFRCGDIQHLAALSKRQQEALENFIGCMRESSTVH